MRNGRALRAGLASLGGLIIVYTVLGPLVIDVIQFTFRAHFESDRPLVGR